MGRNTLGVIMNDQQKKLQGLTTYIRGITGEEFTLVGGCVRDALYNVPAKDYDAVLCVGDICESEAFELSELISARFSRLGLNTQVYQSYGQIEGNPVNPTSFQAMFLSCIKVFTPHGDLDILLSNSENISQHVQKHDCNMNMVWWDSDKVDTMWVHDGDSAKVDYIQFNPDVCGARISVMTHKFHKLNAGLL